MMRTTTTKALRSRLARRIREVEAGAATPQGAARRAAWEAAQAVTAHEARALRSPVVRAALAALAGAR